MHFILSFSESRFPPRFSSLVFILPRLSRGVGASNPRYFFFYYFFSFSSISKVSRGGGKLVFRVPRFESNGISLVHFLFLSFRFSPRSFLPELISVEARKFISKVDIDSLQLEKRFALIPQLYRPQAPTTMPR